MKSIQLKLLILVKAIFCGLLAAFPSDTVEAQVSNEIKKSITADSARLVDIYKDIHQNPELGFTEFRTAAIIEKELQRLGFEITTGFGKTGLTGILKNGPGPVVMYRADMDCNSVKEETNLPYASKLIVKKDNGVETPVMHACGHDAHVTWMLGVARLMVEFKNKWSGTLIMLAQPAEELLQGAVAMVKGGLYNGKIPEPDYLFGMHTWPSATGTVMNGTGVRAAGSDQIDVIFHGVSAHGSAPERSKDAIVMASSAVMQYQSIISRNVSPREIAVLTVSSIHAGVDYNVIPASVALKLNLRWFNDKTRDIILNGIKSINEGLGRANNLKKEEYPELIMKGNAYPLVNDTALTQRINAALAKTINPAGILTNIEPIMGSEDFPFLKPANKKTACDYLFLGIASPESVAKAKARGDEFPFFLHTSAYQVDLAAIPLGTLIGISSILEIFRSKIN